MSRHHPAWLTALLLVLSLACGAAEDVPANITHVKELAKREAARGDKGAQAYLDAMDGKGGEKASNDGGIWLGGAARRGLPEAQFQIAIGYEMEAQKLPDRAAEMHRKAADLYRKAADQGYAPAQMQLANFYAKGQGVPLDNAKAVAWATKAAAAGNVDAQGWVGAKYFEGKLVPKNIPAAVRWLEKAANQGHAIATLLLIGLYQNGKEIPADPVKAQYWMDRVAGKPKAKAKLEGPELVAAAEGGNVNAQATLGFNYLTGRDFPKDGKQALHWLTKAAEAGHAIAQVNLGITYQNGMIVKKDYAQARKWYRLAADQGNARGIEQLTKLDKLEKK